MLKETLDEYLLTYEYLVEKIAKTERRIEEIAEQEKYRECVHNLTCFKGIKTVTALAVVTEIGDFSRFPKAKSFSAFLGLVDGQLDSSDRRSNLLVMHNKLNHNKAVVAVARETVMFYLGYDDREYSYSPCVKLSLTTRTNAY